MRGYSLILVFSLLFPFSILSQENLVRNGNFDKCWYCPPPVSYDSLPCKHWYSPNLGTPDYYHVCSRDSIFSIPNNFSGIYYPNSGNAFWGIVLLAPDSYFEHIQSELIKPLEEGKSYKVSFWVRLVHQFSDYIAYNIGACFSSKGNILGDRIVSGHSYISGMQPTMKADVCNEKSFFLSDTIWTEISGTYVANGGEKYITIGMFWDNNPKVIKAWKKVKNNENNRTIRLFKKITKMYLLKKNPYVYEIYKNRTDKPYAYYLIDNVSVVEIKN